MTGVAGRATVLTEDAELLFGVTAGEAGGITAALTLLLAPLAPLAAPAVTQTNYQTYCCSQGKSFKEGTFSITRDSYLFWLPCICRSCQKSHLLFGSSPPSLHHRRRRRHWTTTPHPHLTTVHLCDIYRGKNYFMKWYVREQWVYFKKGNEDYCNDWTFLSTDLLSLWLCLSFSCSYRPFRPLKVWTYSMDSSAL